MEQSVPPILPCKIDDTCKLMEKYLMDATFWIFTLSLLYPTWRIFVRVGMSGPLALLLLIPGGIGFFITVAVLAFSKWPAIEKKGA